MMFHPVFFGGPLFGLLAIGVIFVGVWLLSGRSLGSLDRFTGNGRARSILSERYARGELTTEEYQERLAHLE
jgi:putative membrane protein